MYFGLQINSMSKVISLANHPIADKRFAEAVQLLEYALAHCATMRIEESHIQQLLDKYGKTGKKLPSLEAMPLEAVIENILKSAPVSKTS
jgi:hypothetical protein